MSHLVGCCEGLSEDQHIDGCFRAWGALVKQTHVCLHQGQIPHVLISVSNSLCGGPLASHTPLHTCDGLTGNTLNSHVGRPWESPVFICDCWPSEYREKGSLSCERSCFSQVLSNTAHSCSSPECVAASPQLEKKIASSLLF